jgi:hypothetical protein
MAPLYVRLPRREAEKLDRAAFELKAHKRDLVAALVARYVDPSTGAGLARLRALGATSRRSDGEVPQPSRPEQGTAPLQPMVAISHASEWVTGMQRTIGEFSEARKCAQPLVRVGLDDGEQLFLQALSAGPDDDFVTLSVYEPGEELTRVVVLRLVAVRKVELLRQAPSPEEEGFVFRPRAARIGFGSAL